MSGAMAEGIFYLLAGPSHAARLVVSLWSLRQHYDGPVAVYTTQRASHAIGRLCAQDERLQVDHMRVRSAHRGKNAAFLTKLQLLSNVPYSVAAHLDADTVIAGDIAPLFAMTSQTPFTATQFARWTTATRPVRRRLQVWQTLSQDVYAPLQWNGMIDDACQPRPAVNGGIFAFRRESALLRRWYELATLGRRHFICDEIALQILLHRFPHRLLDCRWNCSPLYAADTRDVRIWHMHGSKHLHPEAIDIWWPVYETCLRENVAGIAEWTPYHDQRLAKYQQNS